jgi:multisubunit Na+/H+ antiporter MnhG subunit
MTLLIKDVSATQCKDSGLALVLICLILALTTSSQYFLPAAIIVLLVTMTAPGLFKPFARFWFGFSHVLGTFVSRILLTLLFYVLVTPVGLVRKVLGKDAMQLKAWKKGHTSVFHNRDHQYKRQDLEHPY